MSENNSDYVWDHQRGVWVPNTFRHDHTSSQQQPQYNHSSTHQQQSQLGYPSSGQFGERYLVDSTQMCPAYQIPRQSICLYRAALRRPFFFAHPRSSVLELSQRIRAIVADPGPEHLIYPSQCDLQRARGTIRPSQSSWLHREHASY